MKNKIKLDLSEIQPSEDLELIRIDIEHIASTQDHRTFVVLTDGERKNIVEINNYEASMLSFVYKELHLNSHIQTIHQLFLKYLRLYKSEVESVVIESKVGDVIYCSLKLVDKSFNRSFAITSLCDGLILALVTEKPMYAIKDVWTDMDESDDWDYEEYIVDFTEDDDDDDD